MSEQPTALRLAAVVSYLEGSERSQWMMDAAAELCRLHELNEELLDSLIALAEGCSFPADDVQRIAKEAGLGGFFDPDWDLTKELNRFATLVAAAERQACAAMVEPVDESLADEIRARGEK